MIADQTSQLHFCTPSNTDEDLHLVLRILQIMFSRGRGGLERVFMDHAELLAQRAHHVHCLISKGAACEEDLRLMASRSNGFIVLHVIATKGWKRTLMPWKLAQLIELIEPEILVAHGAKSVSRLSLVRPSHVPLVAVTHNDSARLLKATHLIALTQCLSRSFAARGFPQSRMHEVPNPLPSWAACVPRRQPSPLGQPLKIGTLSRLVGKKGIDLFLRGFRIALDRGLRAEAVIGGDGEDRPMLEALSRSLGLDSQVSFAGWVSCPVAFYAAIDSLCIPSRDEPFGLVALECFANGVPVIAAAVGGLTEIIDHGIDGLLFRAEDPSALADALLVMQARPELAEQFRNAAYGNLDRYRPERITTRIESVLHSAISDIQIDFAAGITEPI